MVGSFPALAAASTLAGASYAFANAGTSVAVVLVSPRERSGAAVAVKTAGIPIGATLMVRTGPPAADLIGWPGVCLVLAGLAAANAGAAATVLPGTRPRPTGPPVARPSRLPRGYSWVCLAAVFFVVGSQPLTSWLVLTLVDEGISRTTAGLVSAAGTGLGRSSWCWPRAAPTGRARADGPARQRGWPGS